jgi:hypothetical protein
LHNPFPLQEFLVATPKVKVFEALDNAFNTTTVTKVEAAIDADLNNSTWVSANVKYLPNGTRQFVIAGPDKLTMGERKELVRRYTAAGWVGVTVTATAPPATAPVAAAAPATAAPAAAAPVVHPNVPAPWTITLTE